MTDLQDLPKNADRELTETLTPVGPLRGGKRLPLAAIAKPPRISRQLHTAAGWLEEMSKLYREARRRQLDSTEASRLAWICTNAAKLAAQVEELGHLEAMRRELDKFHGEHVALPEPPTAGEAAGADDLLDPMPSPVPVPREAL